MKDDGTVNLASTAPGASAATQPPKRLCRCLLSWDFNAAAAAGAWGK